MPDQNIAVVKRIFEGLNSGNLGVLDEFVDPQLVDHSTLRAPKTGAEGLKQRLAGFVHAFPDLEFRIHTIFGAGDMVTLIWSLQGTHENQFLTIPPTGKRVHITGINVERLTGGKLVEHWSIPDNIALFEQLGVLRPLARLPVSSSEPADIRPAD
jgi:predicted ester cyclase